MIEVGLRIDVDTLRGTRVGVPNLVALLGRHAVRASFFFSAGPDNMGRHLRRLLKPAFLLKMLRTRAASLYGWDILLRGTLWPGPVIARRCRPQIRETAAAGHEIGLHAWDHHLWQTRLQRMDQTGISREIQRGCDALTEALGRAPDCFAAPAWRVTPEALLALDHFPFRFESDCRGHALFRPLVDGRQLRHVQVPTTLPTYDEVIGSQCTAQTYNAHLLSLLRPEALNVLTIHAEVEGINCLPLFHAFLTEAKQRGIVFAPLGDLLPAGEIPFCGMHPSAVAGRDGWLACQDADESLACTRSPVNACLA